MAGEQLYDIVAGTFYVQTQRINPNETSLFVVAGPSEFSPSFRLTLTDEQLEAMERICRAARAAPCEPRQNAA